MGNIKSPKRKLRDSIKKNWPKKNEINGKKIGIIGHSEGGMIAPMIAASDKSIAFLVVN